MLPFNSIRLSPCIYALYQLSIIILLSSNKFCCRWHAQVHELVPGLKQSATIMAGPSRIAPWASSPILIMNFLSYRGMRYGEKNHLFYQVMSYHVFWVSKKQCHDTVQYPLIELYIFAFVGHVCFQTSAMIQCIRITLFWNEALFNSLPWYCRTETATRRGLNGSLQKFSERTKPTSFHPNTTC
jgi:hypothetical protein